MLLTELYSMLSYGELSNLAMSNNGGGTIIEDARPRVLVYTNEALLRLHTKFILSEKKLILELQEGTTNYHLKSAYSVQGFDDTVALVPYIIDLPLEKFSDDVIKVLGITNNLNTLRPLNDANHSLSVKTVTPTTLNVPSPLKDEVLFVKYQARHKKVDANNQVIDLPDTLHGALTAFIAYKVYNAINTQESMAIGQGHLSMFDSICKDVVETDTVNTSESGTNAKFHNRGWV